jgi:hypothetical protein
MIGHYHIPLTLFLSSSSKRIMPRKTVPAKTFEDGAREKTAHREEQWYLATVSSFIDCPGDFTEMIKGRCYKVYLLDKLVLLIKKK